MRALETFVCIICVLFCVLIVPIYFKYKEESLSTEQANKRMLEELAYEIEQTGRISLETLYYIDAEMYAYDKDMIVVAWSEICNEMNLNGFYDFKGRQDRFVVISYKNTKKYIRLR